MVKSVAQNRRARFDFEILETIEAGMALSGPEVKSCRAGAVNLSGAYVSFFQGKPVLKSATISLYKFAAGVDTYKPMRDRPLLLHKAESVKMQNALGEKGLTVVPLEIKAGRYIKVILGIARGRKHFDKRQKIKEREVRTKLKRGEEY